MKLESTKGCMLQSGPSLPIAAPGEIGINTNRLRAAYDQLSEWTTVDGPIPGAALVVGRSGKMLEPRYFGRQGPEPGAEPIRKDGLFLLASITKPIVYSAAMRFVERGDLRLSDLVTKYIPDFAAHHKEATQLIHLFTHTSGLPDMVANNELLRRRHAPLADFTTAVVRDTVPLFRPGTNFSYQSMGTLMVAEILQLLTKRSIRDVVYDQVLAPLGMHSTRLGSQGLDSNRIVRVKTVLGQATDWDWNSEYWRSLGVPWGGMFSAPQDLAILCQTLLEQGRYGDTRLWHAETVQAMTTNRLPDFPELSAEVARNKAWGLGWQLNHPQADDSLCDQLGPHVYGHLGSTGTLLWIDPQQGAFCVLLTTAPRDSGPERLVKISNLVALALS